MSEQRPESGPYHGTYTHTPGSGSLAYAGDARRAAPLIRSLNAMRCAESTDVCVSVWVRGRLRIARIIRGTHTPCQLVRDHRKIPFPPWRGWGAFHPTHPRHEELIHCIGVATDPSATVEDT